MTGPTGVAVRRRFLPFSYSDHRSSGIRFARVSTVAAIHMPAACVTVCATVAVRAPAMFLHVLGSIPLLLTAVELLILVHRLPQ